jgi:hypothetical protein
MLKHPVLFDTAFPGRPLLLHMQFALIWRKRKGPLGEAILSYRQLVRVLGLAVLRVPPHSSHKHCRSALLARSHFLKVHDWDGDTADMHTLGCSVKSTQFPAVFRGTLHAQMWHAICRVLYRSQIAGTLHL